MMYTSLYRLSHSGQRIIPVKQLAGASIRLDGALIRLDVCASTIKAHCGGSFETPPGGSRSLVSTPGGVLSGNSWSSFF
jgi:hypothetical protein